MIPYLAIGIFCMIIGGITHVNARDPREKLLGRRGFRMRPTLIGMGLLFTVLTLFAGLRGAFTADYNTYVSYFRYVRELPIWEILTRGFTMERGFVLFSHFFGLLTDSGVLYMLVLAAITMAFFFKAFREQSVMPCLSVVLFLAIGNYYESFNATRQVLAIAMAFWATRYINEKKTDFWKYLVWILLASTVHKTVLIMIPFYAVKWIRPNFWTGITCIIVFVLAWLVLPTGVWLLQKVFPQYGLDFGMGGGTINAVIPFLGVGAFVWVGVYFADVDYEKIENRVQVFGLIATLFFLGLGVRIYLFTRMASYFKPLVCLLVPTVISKLNVQKMPLPLQKFNAKTKWGNKQWQLLLISAIALVSLAYVFVWLSGTGYDPYYLSGEWF
ncbi:MAG: EpsG family protein [Clostridia bacterium]|nr:EpsG family protein [Clostridia bacterium]